MRNMLRNADDTGYPTTTCDESYGDGELDAERQYLSAVHHIPLLSPDEELALLNCIGRDHDEQPTDSAHNASGAPNARDRLVEGYQPLVILLARRFTPRCSFLTLLDLVQEGNLGLLQAIERYDAVKARDASFRTWAVWWITGAIRNAIRQYERCMPLPARLVSLAQRLMTAHDELTAALEREPTEAELAEAVGQPATLIREAQMAISRRVVSLSDLFSPADDDPSSPDHLDRFIALADTTADNDASDLPTRAERVRAALGKLSSIERAVIIHRYGFIDGRTHSYTVVAERLGVTPATATTLDRHARAHLYDVLAPYFLPHEDRNVA